LRKEFGGAVVPASRHRSRPTMPDRDWGRRSWPWPSTDLDKATRDQLTRGEKLSEFFSQGDQIIIRGQLRSRSWETDDGQKRSATEVIGDDWEFGAKKGAGSGQQSKAKAQRPAETADDDSWFNGDQ